MEIVLITVMVVCSYSVIGILVENYYSDDPCKFKISVMILWPFVLLRNFYLWFLRKCLKKNNK